MCMDEMWMRKALEEAEKAAGQGEIPVGAVIVRNGEAIAYAHNERGQAARPTGHAEIIALERAAARLGEWKLDGCTIYVTLEPCVMCAGAIIQARLDRVVFGAYDDKAGCFGSLADLTVLPFDKKPDIFGGVLEEKCEKILNVFFARMRAKTDS